ncbi:hypothetical protein Y032_0629g850 [Ancylostoma ceylanicum]|uniref:Integrase catalytic domain-containing protein n=1 Tax=Ancylostoma ceylanicum TaxID=53326 RepID=A0A016WM84_9BILA|nr:hypothetical protein Y032_0629g850 [Ancylostoma ceylanicum]
MPPLPLDRVIVAKPFKNTGCDFMGPFTSKTQDKMYVCLYTCLTTRAVHLEVVENLSTAAFLTSFIRFISRRGVSNTMRSDCGTNFKNGEQIIDAMFRKDDDSGASVMTYCAKERIKWIFNPPASSWMGGVWERLVGSVKKALNKSIGRRKLTFADMCTVITRIEAIFNTRPLTKCDPEDLTKIPLRPVDFLQGNVKFSIPDTHVDERDPQFDPSFIRTEKQALEALRFSEKIADKFWETWKIQYLVSLREMEKINYKQPRHSSRSIPELGEIVLIEQDLIPRGNWPYGKVVELISSADELVRSAKILMPNHRIIQRPLNKIFPLEIRSVPENRKTNDVETIDKDLASTTSRRQLPSRAAKTRAYDVIRDFEESLESHPQISCSARTSLSMIMVFCLISPSICGNVSSSIQCSSGKVKIIPPGGPFQLCFNSDCHIPAITERNLSFSLPISPRNDKVHVHLSSLLSNRSFEQSEVCDRPLFCDHQYFLSKSILGNPHCWPAGAIATIAALTYLAIMALISMLCAVSKLRKRISTPGVLSRRKRSQPIQTSAVNFELMPLPSALAICAIICSLSSSALACQHGYMRHTADLICKDRARCYLEYNRELFFNKLQSELCVEIFHDEKPIGTARFTKKPVEFKCSKVIESFTRMTTTSVYHSKRCAQAGSCTDDICERVKANDTIPELSKAMRYPGYSGCFSSCGGFLCGCFMPQPACSFYRVAHEPVSEDIFEVSRCSHWSPTVSINFELEIEGNRTSWSESLVPYVSKEIDGFNLTIISIQKPTNSMANKRFAISNNDSFILQDDFRLPVECYTYTQAKNQFASCPSRIRCECSNSINNCLCPETSLRHNSEARLPFKTPYFRVELLGNQIMASSNDEEVVLRVQSRILQDSAALTQNQKCALQISNLTGCYDCEHGSHVTIACTSPTQTVVTATCGSQYFPINCGPNGEKTSLQLHFEKALINETCMAFCMENPTKFILQGHLHYHVLLPNASVFHYNSHTVSIKHQWFSDISIPDFSPMINVIKHHWKLAIAAIGVTLALSALTYLMGPIVLIYLAKFLFRFLPYLLSCLFNCFGRPCKTVGTAREQEEQEK